MLRTPSIQLKNRKYSLRQKQPKYIDGLVQDCSNSIVNALELRQSYATQLVQSSAVITSKLSHCYIQHSDNSSRKWIEF